MQIDTTSSRYKIKASNPDNAAGFTLLQKDMVASLTKPIVFLPSGIILSSFTRWTHKVNSFKVIGDGTTLKSLYKGDDEAQQRGLFPGEMMQTNVLEYKGTKQYVNAWPIETAKAGDRQIITKGLSPFFGNERLFIRSGDLFAGGYPRACRSFDWVETPGVYGHIITLKMPLTEDYFDYDGAEIFSLDEVNYCESAEFEGITFDGNFAYPARKQILTRCNILGLAWASECEEIIWNDVYAEKVEFDKLVKSVVCNNLRTPSSPSNGGSINSIEMNDCTTGSIRLCPRYLTLNRPKPWANKVLINENPDKYDTFIPCIADAPARNPIRRYTINEPTYLSGIESQADSNLEFAPFEEITI